LNDSTPDPTDPYPPANPAGTVTLAIAIRPARVVLVLLACTLALSLLSLIANVMWAQQTRGAETAIQLFGVDQEGSLPTWWSALLLVSLGGLTWLVAHHRKSIRWSERLAWWALAGGFVFLSIDESCMLHERIGRRVQWDGSLHHARWILLWLPPPLILAALIFWQLWRASRRFVLGMILGVVVFLSGAVGMEALNATYRYNAETLVRQQEALANQDNINASTPPDWRVGSTYYPYALGTALEELLEVLGAVIWFAVLLNLYREQTESHKYPARPAAATA
jgi:hypothetical protein